MKGEQPSERLSMILREQGGERKVVRFAASTLPGHQSQTDATRLRVLGVEIAEEAQTYFRTVSYNL